MSRIYRAPVVASLKAFFSPLLELPAQGAIISDYLGQLAAKIYRGLQTEGEHQRALYALFSNYHPAYLGWSTSDLAKASFDLDDCRNLVAKERGFDDWTAVEGLGDQRFDPDFEQALQWLLAGELGALKSHLRESPALVHQRSPYPHEATLLHYLGSNGLELWRQQVPFNLVELIRLLLDAGADPAAKMRVYGGAFNTAELLGTSAHPAEAGVAEAALLALEGK